MKIKSIETFKLKIPLNKPMRTRYINLECAYCLLVKIYLDSDIVGQGLIRAVSDADISIAQDFIKKFFYGKIIDEDFNAPEEIWNKLWLSKRNHLQSSFGLYALAAIDIAIWDILGKQQNKPLHQLLNIKEKYVTPYGNGGWLKDTNAEMAQDIEWYLSRGCNHFKMRIGCESDLQRIKFIRNTFGDQLILAADANQYYDFDAAVSMSKLLADFNVLWFEEPLFSSSLTALSELAALSPVTIATGENFNSHWQILDACKLNAAEIFQPDVIHQGGITEFKRSAEIIQSNNLSLGAHLFHELSISLAGLCDKHYVEHIDFFPDDFFENDFSIRNGKIFLPHTPGNGVTISDFAIKKYHYL